ncbi:CynX/NimT family MFS transporter [Enterobacter sp. Ap-916]|uniref:CynX/NimT family MFS transporter n=1 Tax=unclassified Enterobacter TaxID=2608935 RepID=UPI0014229E7B|nr:MULTISPECIES: CynX/NimT family MFS transporter [unclassified Enterobacter]NIF59004.1 CynX/NimT family MFS transporter [Enterobacter sp. Ap-867]NIG29580.1 CynX/NimT family MFS transporter [Enterobacter sp. Ap-916]
MTSTTSASKKSRALLLLGILMIATTLRVTFTGAAPLLDMVRDALALSTAQIGILTTLPLLAFAVVSPLAAGIARRFGTERSLFGALLIICAGIALRSAGHTALLYIGTAIIGCGIAMGNVLLPSLLKRDFPGQVAKLTGAYSLTMGVAAALGSVMVVPIALHGFGWSGAMLSLMIFPLLALIVWLPQLGSSTVMNLSGNPALHSRGIWSSPLAWQVTLYLGINSLVYYVIIGWLPSILISHGYNEAEAGSIHGILQLATAIPGLFVGLILSRLKDQRGIAALMALLWCLATLGLWLLPAFSIFWVSLGGFGSGAAMILGLSFIGMRTGSAHQAAALSGMAQCVGYLLAAFGPPVMGKIHDITGSWAIPLLGCALLSVVMGVFGAYAGRQKEIGAAEKAAA